MQVTDLIEGPIDQVNNFIFAAGTVSNSHFTIRLVFKVAIITLIMHRIKSVIKGDSVDEVEMEIYHLTTKVSGTRADKKDVQV